jgi:polysaccharide pyruvyl transferase WcaK-like protein
MSTGKSGDGSVRVLLVHAYSRSNAGDGLLVDESSALVREAFPNSTINVVALAPDSFPEYPDALHPLYGKGSRSAFRLLCGILGRQHPSVVEARAQADLIVAVGGGYLRSDGVKSFAKTRVAHFTQLPRAHNGTPVVYLPQSIGPFLQGSSPISRLRDAYVVHVRDDRSRHFLEQRNIRAERTPDLATLSPSLITATLQSGSGYALVARQLSNPAPGYDDRLRRVLNGLNATLMVQSTGRGNNDPEFYRRLGFGDDHPRLVDALSDRSRPQVVLSVRLHGSLQALHAGVPTIHLSYERKGWGAFSDLGLSEYVHSARTFDPEIVIEQAESIAADPKRYWSALQAAQPRLQQSRQGLIASLQAAVKTRP